MESRLTHGVAQRRAGEIIASDEPDRALLSACDAAMTAARALASRIDGRVRVVVRATPDGVETTFSVTLAQVSIVSTPEYVMEDAAMLRELVQPVSKAVALPPHCEMVWMRGSAAVLLHEAFGHPAEHDAPLVACPEWLRVEAPLAMRRESFSDVPLVRMTKVVASQEDAPFDVPEERIEVHLVAGGAYDPITDEVTTRIAVADLVRGGGRERIDPFAIRARRAAVAKALRGATGATLRYPGVICSREGQELHVPSAAPVIITDPLPMV